MSNLLLKQSDLTIISSVGRGEFATVYKVNHVKDGVKKVQIARVLRSVKNHYDLKREKELLRYLNQYGEQFPTFNEIRKVGFHYIQLFDFVSDIELEHHVNEVGRLKKKRVKKLLLDMVLTLDKCHQAGFVHGDIKPDNILITDDSYYLMGWSQAMSAKASFETELMIGDLLYAAPERMNGEFLASGDIYSLGCTLYFALTAKHIFGLSEETENYEKLYAQANFNPVDSEQLSKSWRHLIIWMTQKKPEHRPTLAELTQWQTDKVVPRAFRKPTDVATKNIPDDPIMALKNQNFSYGLFKMAVVWEGKKRYRKAFKAYEKLAFNGYSRAEHNLACLYENGYGTVQSIEKAVHFYERAYRQGNPFSASSLGRLLMSDQHGLRNDQRAVTLTKYAAMKGRVSAQNRLGCFYLTGLGIPSNKERAIFWLSLAMVNGHSEAKKTLSSLVG